jgi:hypothetical protein
MRGAIGHHPGGTDAVEGRVDHAGAVVGRPREGGRDVPRPAAAGRVQGAQWHDAAFGAPQVMSPLPWVPSVSARRAAHARSRGAKREPGVLRKRRLDFVPSRSERCPTETRASRRVRSPLTPAAVVARARSWARFPRFRASVPAPIRGDDGPRVEGRVLWGWERGGVEVFAGGSLPAPWAAGCDVGSAAGRRRDGGDPHRGPPGITRSGVAHRA